MYDTTIPSTMQNWLTSTSRPRFSGGAISAMYIGTATDTPPIANPPMNRIHPNTCGGRAVAPRPPPGVNAHPTAETRNSTPIHTSVGLRPSRSHIRPAANAPNTVPISAPATTSPCQNGARANSSWIASSHPEMTPESNPNKSPPSDTAQVIQ